MRPSPKRNTLAVLRLLIGHTQKEMASLLGCSVPTIQAIELGKLTLSLKLAERIAYETGVSLGWLKRGDVAAPPLTSRGHPYTRKGYDVCRSELSRPRVADSDRYYLHFVLYRCVQKTTALLRHAYEKDQFTLAAYKVETALAELVEEFKAPLPPDPCLQRNLAIAAKFIEAEVQVECASGHHPDFKPALNVSTQPGLPPLDLSELVKGAQGMISQFHDQIQILLQSKADKLVRQRAAKKRSNPKR